MSGRVDRDPEELLGIKNGRLFTRYTAAAESTGLGLGLYLAHNIVAAHGGTLTVDSKAGMGATFRMSLPVISAAA